MARADQLGISRLDTGFGRDVVGLLIVCLSDALDIYILPLGLLHFL